MVRTQGLWQALVVSGIVLASLDLLYAFLPAWAADRGVSVTTVGWLPELRASITVLIRVGLARLAGSADASS